MNFDRFHKVSVAVYMTPHERLQLRFLAEKHRMNMSDYVMDLLKPKFFAKQELT